MARLLTPTLTGNDPATAGARTIIRRALRSQKLPADGSDESLAGYFIAHPWACTRAIEARIESAVQAWTDGNNSGDSEQHSRGCRVAERYYSHVERLMGLLDVRMDYPGLYPTYLYAGRTHYDLPGLWAAIKESRAACTLNPTRADE